MATKNSWLFLLLVGISFPVSQVLAGSPNWPQFRGPNSSGIAAEEAQPPINFDQQQNLLWKTPLPAGHSSPCIWGDHIFVTGYEAETQTFRVFCLMRQDGSIKWQRSLAVETVEKVHATSNPAAATPTTDGERVYVYFGSFGVLCYDFDGQEQWRRPLPILQTPFGAAASPVVSGELVLLNRDDRTQPLLMGLNRLTGETRWESALPPDNRSKRFRGSYATPVRWGNEWVVHRSGQIAAYSAAGVLQWTVPAVSGGATTPVVGAGTLFVSTWSNFGEDQLRVDLPDFSTFVAEHDADGDGGISVGEIPADQKVARRPEATPDTPGGDVPLGRLFGSFDSDSSGVLGAAEWQAGRQRVRTWRRDHGLVALGRKDPLADEIPQVLWQENKSAAEVPSPIFFEGLVYMVKNGGIVSCLEAASGKLLYRKRLGARGSYYASPIVAGGKIYAVSEQGTVVVFNSGKTLEVMARNDLEENIYATPAVVEDKIYIRSTEHLFCFGK